MAVLVAGYNLVSGMFASPSQQVSREFVVFLSIDRRFPEYGIHWFEHRLLQKVI